MRFPSFCLTEFRICFIALCIGQFSLALRAEDRLDSTKVYSIDEVTVTEHYRNTEVRSSSPLQIISSKQIEKLNALQVSDAVKYFSGVTVKDYGGIGGLKTVSVRSLGAAHTAVSYDGITLTDCQTGQIDIGRFSLDNVDLLSLNNGQSDNIFQPARMFASASLLNIRTLSPKFTNNKTLNGKVSLKTGSFGLLNPAFLLQHKISTKYSASLSGEWLSAHGEYPYLLHHSYLGDGITSNEVRKNSDVQNFRIEGALHANFSENESGYLKTYFYNSERGLPGATIFYNEKAFTSQRIHDYTFFSQAHYRKDFSRIFSLQLNAKYHHGFVHYLDTTFLNQTGYEESKHRQNEFYTSVSMLFRTFENLSFSFSTDGIINNLFAQYDNAALTENFPQPTRYNLLSVFAAKYADNHILATASLLSTLITETTKTSTEIKNHQRLTPFASIAYKPFGEIDLRVRAFYKNIFRLPTFNDMYYARILKSNLKPETTQQFNAGITYTTNVSKTSPIFTVTADFYRNTIQDKIVAIPAKNLFYWSVVNLGNVEIKGVDLTAETSIALNKNFIFSVGGSYTWQSALDVTTPGSSTYGHQIPYTPRVSGSWKAAIETPYGNLAYALLWSGARYAGYQNYIENRMPGFTDHSISYSKNISLKTININLKGEVLNFMNENYAIVRYYPMPGRSVRITAGVRL